MSKQTNPTRTCQDCLHCLACHLWSSGAISATVAPKCPQFKPARYASLAELQDLYRMYKGELVPVVHGRWEPDMYFDQPVMRCTACKIGFAEGHHAERFRFCPHCGAKMDGGTEQ